MSPGNWKGIDSVKSKFDVRRRRHSGSELLKELERYMRGLDEFSIPYCDLQKPYLSGAFKAFEGTPGLRGEIKEWNEKIRRIGPMVTFIPLLCAIRLEFPHDAEKYLEALRNCEAFAFRVYSLKRSRSNNGRNQIAKDAHRFRKGEISFGGAMHAVRAHLNHRCNDEEYYSLFKQHADRGSWYDWRGLRYLLFEYEHHLAAKRKASPRVGWQHLHNATIEHILPQTIEGVPYWEERFSPEEHRKFKHDLGNLTMTRYNSELSNRPFPAKKGGPLDPNTYASSSLFQEQELAAVEDWTPEAIVERRERLLNWARQRWWVDLSAFGNQPEMDDEELDEYGDEDVVEEEDD